jgi:2-polyprenyl-6-methoxyphenol hydroxylase-like FAD-dependent oxidoreductase
MSNLNILISGSGIAGSVYAFWLLRAYPNANITIVERDPSLRLTGASVDIRSSAVDIIKWMGAEQEIRTQTTN